MKPKLASAVIVLAALVLPAAAVASQPEVRLSGEQQAADERAADRVALQLLAAISSVEFAIELPDDYVSLDPNYDPLAGWSPD